MIRGLVKMFKPSSMRFKDSPTERTGQSTKHVQRKKIRLFPALQSKNRHFSDKAEGSYYMVTFNTEAICGRQSPGLPQASLAHRRSNGTSLLTVKIMEKSVADGPSTVNSRGN